MAKKIELLHTTYDESGNIESQEVVHPLTSPDCVIMENGETLADVMGDGIATPTLTHEGTSFKVGVGDSNIEVVDGDVAGMTLKGQSYQNILPKPTTLIMETDEKEFKINDKIDSNIIIDDNIAEIATVKGKTIVNTVQEESGSEYTVLGEDLSGQSIVHVKETLTLEGSTLNNICLSKGGTYSPNNGITVDSVKGDAKYYIQLEYNAQSSTKGIVIQNYDTAWISNCSNLIYKQNSTKVIIVVQTHTDATKLRILNPTSSESSVTFSDVMVIEYQEGMENWDIPYFKGEKYFEANIKGVTLQGQTLVNTIQEPCKDNYVVLGSEDGIEISAETGGHGTIEDTVQGGLNGAVLEGMTLVNTISNIYDSCKLSVSQEVSMSSEDTTWDSETYRIKAITFTKNMLPNITYLIKLKVTELTGTDKLGSYVVDTDGNMTYSIANGVLGENNFIYTPTVEIKKIAFYLDDIAGKTASIKEPMVIEYQEGMENWDIPYFEGMKSVQMPILRTVGKNTLDYRICGTRIGATIKNITNNSITFNAPQAWAGLSWVYFLEPNQTYTASFKTDLTTEQLRGYVRFPSTNLNAQGGSHSFSFTTDSTGKIQFTIESVTGAEEDIVVSDIQIEQGSKATSYEPYQSSTVTTEKNLFDGMLTPDYLTDGTGQPSGLTGSLAHSCYTPSFIPIQANEKFRLKATSDKSTTVGDGRVYFYDKDYNYLNVYVTSLEVYTATYSMDVINTVPNNSNIAYMRVRFFNGLGVQADSVQINKVYELRGIGDVKDELDLQTGKLTQRIYEVVFDGSSDEDWVLNNTANTTTNRFIITIPKSKVTNDEKGKQSYLCDKLQKNLWSDTRTIGITIIDNAVFLYNKDIDYSIDALRNWLQSNPITIQYPLATESVKTIDLTVTDQDDNTIPHIQTQPTVTHITASSDYLIPTVTIDNNLSYETIIKPSTLYTVRFKHNAVNADNPLTVDLGGTTQTVTSTEFTITTPSTLTHNQLVFSGKNNVVSEVQVIEGDVTNIEYPFFEGMNDVKFSDSKFVGRGRNLLHVSKGFLTTNNYNGLTVTRDETKQTITINGTCTTDNTSFALAPLNMLMKEGKRYILSAELISGTSDKIVFRVNTSDWSSNISCSCESSNNYKNSTAMTFWRDRLYDVSSCRVDSGTTFTNATYRVMLEEKSEGSATTYEPYKGVEVQQDIDSIPLTSDMFEQGARERGMGFSMQQCPLSSNTGRISSKTLIPVKPNSKYTVSGIDTSVNHIWGDMYDKNGLVCYDSVLDLTGGISSGTGVFVPHDVHYLCIKVKNADESAITPSALDSMNLILQEVPQEIVLRAIGDVKDELDLTRGEYIQRIGEIIFDGDDSNLVDKYVISGANKTYVTVVLPGTKNNVNHARWYNELLKSKNLGAALIESQPLSFMTTGDTTIRFTFFGGSNLELLKEKEMLRKYPITVQYILATPIIHKVNLTNMNKIPSYATETHYETITPSDSLIPNITIPSTINYNVAIKPSTEYTIRANTSDNLTVDLGGATGTLSNGKVTLTTPATLTHNEVKFSGTGKVKELMVVEGNEVKDNVPFFNGMKDVQMGGIKLVNIARGATCNNLVTTNTNKTQFTYTGNGTNWGDILFDKSLLKQNTLYTIYLNVISSNSDNENPIKISMGDDLNTWLNISSTGLFKKTFATNDNIENLFGINFRPCTSGQQVVIQNPMIIEGDWTHLDEIPFIESEMIIDQPIIRSQGKNLLDLESKYFNPSNVTYTKSGTTYTVVGNTSNYNYGQFAWTTETSAWFRNLLGKEVTLSVSSISCTNANSKACIQVRIECTDGSKVYKTISTNDDADYETFTIPSNAIDMALQLMSNNTGSPLDSESTLTVSNIQLELGNTATSYKAYRHQTLYSNRVIGYEENCYYQYGNGKRVTNNANFHSIIADVEGLSVAYVTNGHSNFSFWDKDDVYISGKAFMDTNRYGDENNNGFITVPSNAKYIRFPAGKTGEVTSDWTKTTVTGELPLRSLPNGVCDTLNLVTGEYVQRVGEVVFDGSENWMIHASSSNLTNCIHFFENSNMNTIKKEQTPYATPIRGNTYSEHANSDNERVMIGGSPNIHINILKERLATQDVDGFKQYLSQNPITVQYELVTPIVRKLGFTTKGNYREQVLDGSETWAMDAIDNTKTVRMTKKTTSPLQNALYNTVLFTDDYHVRASGESHGTYEYIVCIGNGIYINIYQSRVEQLSVQGCTQWLSQNPIKVGYITSAQSSESYSNIHKPIFFNNVDVQFLPNNIDIQPELTLQARTRNSYVMDMMKANTKYSVKLLLNTGEFVPTIDGINNPLVNGRTFTSPSTLTNKLLITPCIKELMIIEGDVTGKNLPYFKGILSSYHDVHEIELYSVNKNLFDMSKVEPYEKVGTYWWNTIIKENEVVSVRIGDINNGQFGAYIKLNVRPSSTYTLYVEMEKDGEPFNGQIYAYENDDLWGTGSSMGYANSIIHVRTTSQAKYITIGFNYGKDFPIGTTLVSKNIRLYLGEENPVYIPHSHNTTLIEMPTRLETVKVVRPVMEIGAINTGNGAEAEDTTNSYLRSNFIPVQPKEFVYFLNGSSDRVVNLFCYDINKNFICYLYNSNDYVPENCYFVRIYMSKANSSDLTMTRMAYKPIQLNSLPNGVCDEIIIKPNSNKAQIIQRVDKLVLDGIKTDIYKKNINAKGENIFNILLSTIKNESAHNQSVRIRCDVVSAVGLLETWNGTRDGIANATNGQYLQLNVNRRIIGAINETVQNSLQQNPITVYYELATPIIHEIQLKGYPHVHENGTVTLNTDIPHKTLVSYNVNQEQLINTQNETIIRHDQQIDDLYYYIEMYLEEIYQMELFRMKLELSL